MECRVKSIKDGDATALDIYDRLFEAQDLELLPVSRAVLDTATDLRAKWSLRSPDAIHLASALISNADVFLTGDRALARCADVRVEVLEG